MSAAADKKSIYYIVDDYWACGWYRCHVPGEELRRRGYRVALNEGITPEQVEQFDIIVFQRQWLPVAAQAMEYARALGKTIVYELDDDLWNLHPTNPGWVFWHEKLGAISNAESMLRYADIVTTTTPALAKQLRRFNANVQVLPNMLPGAHWTIGRERPETYDKLTLGWAGSVKRSLDVAVIREVALQLIGSHPNMHLLITGDSAEEVFPPNERIHKLEGVSILEYPRLLSLFDVGMAPIVDSRFNQAKSDLKFLEYGMLGIPAVFSDVEAYRSSVVHGENGFLAKNDKQWLKYLTRLLDDADLRAGIGAAAKAYAESRTIERNIGLWEKAYGIDLGAGGDEPAA